MVIGEHLTKTFNDGSSERMILNRCSFNIQEGKMTALIGKSGSGKTTLLNIIGGLEPVNSGSLNVDGIELSGLNETDLDNFRSEKIGFIFQDYKLLDDFTVLENICILSDLSGKKRSVKKLLDLLEILELTDLADHYPEQLSGGEKQRTAIARALYGSPSIILADEPTGNLDRSTAVKVFDLLKEACEIYGQTVLMVTHDLSLGKQADNLLVLDDGKVSPYEVE